MNNTDFYSIEVGATLPDIKYGPVTRAALALYAGASGDHNPIHIDSDFAKRAGLDDVFAHGMLSMAQIGRVVTDWAGIDRVRSISARFQAITHVGDCVTCSGKVIEAFEENQERRLRIQLAASTSTGNATIVGEAVIAVQ